LARILDEKVHQNKKGIFGSVECRFQENKQKEMIPGPGEYLKNEEIEGKNNNKNKLLRDHISRSKLNFI
jgi:hypothetical protein